MRGRSACYWGGWCRYRDIDMVALREVNAEFL
jgi:hypothetical protein